MAWAVLLGIPNMAFTIGYTTRHDAEGGPGRRNSPAVSSIAMDSREVRRQVDHNIRADVDEALLFDFRPGNFLRNRSSVPKAASARWRHEADLFWTAAHPARQGRR